MSRSAIENVFDFAEEKGGYDYELELARIEFAQMLEGRDSAIAAAVLQETERNCAAMCEQCAAGIKAQEGPDSWGGRFIHWLDSEQRYIGCGATRIRAAAIRNGTVEREMKLTDSQIKMLDDIAMGRTTLARDWRTRKALQDRKLITHNAATWKYPEPYYRLTDLGMAEWAEHTVEA